MQNRHTTQIRELLQKKRLSKSRFNPESQIVINSPSMKQSRQIKKSESSTSLHQDKQKLIEIQIMEKRYQDLYQEYFNIVEEAKKRAQMCKKQEEEISKYEKAGKRDKKQIERLKSMIGYIHKQQNGVQTIEDSSHFERKDKFVSTSSELINKKTLKQSRSRKDLSTGSNKKYCFISENDQNTRFNIENSPCVDSRDSKLLKKSHLGYKNLLSSKQQIDKEKELLKRFESTKMAESLLYGNKSSIDFRKKRADTRKGSQVIENGEESKFSRVNSPNSRFKFIPSVDI